MASETSDPQSPLVSIICRTMGRPELGEALASAAAQTHSPLEIILVDAAGLGEAAYREAYTDNPVAFASSGSPLSRPEAANFGLERAKGEYLLFLDEDDWLAPDHVENLLACLSEEILAAYSSARKMDPSGKLVLAEFGRPYDVYALMRENYIPIHSMIFSRSLIEKGCRFDTSFEIFEDWDFWLQLSEHTEFRHVNKYTAFYRAGGESQTADLVDMQQRFDPIHLVGKARAAVYSKWLKHWDGEKLNQLAGAGQREIDRSSKHIDELGRELDRLALAVQEAERRVDDTHRKNDELRHKLSLARDTHVRAEARLVRAEARLVRAEARHVRAEARLNAMIQELRKANLLLHDKVEDLRIDLENVFNSRSWKITHPYRVLGAWLKPKVAGASAELAVKSDASTREEAKLQTPQSMKHPESADFKAAFDRRAILAMEEFFASGEKLNFPKHATPVLSILIVFFNQAHLSLLCLRALLEHADVPFELIVVDNASSDQTIEFLARLENTKLIRNTENLGFVKAVNQGAELAVGEFLLLLNNDAFIESGALGAALSVLRDDTNVGAVGGRISLLDGKLQEAGNIIWRDGSCTGYGRGADPEDCAFQFQREVDYCSGAFLMFRTERFYELGGLDESFSPAYYEESDFCLRLRQHSLRTIYEPCARLSHYEFASTGSLSQAVALQEKNRELFRKKHAKILLTQPEANLARVVSARTSNDYPNVLLIDDIVPHPSLGKGYPRCCNIVRALSQMPINVSFYPLQFPNDNWEDVYRTLPRNVEVLLNLGRSNLKDLLIERENFFQYILISRPPNMTFFINVLKSLPKQAKQFAIIYDAEAVFAARDLLWRELKGEIVTEEEKKRILSAEIDISNMASSVVTVSEDEAKLFRDHGKKNVMVLGHSLSLKPELAPLYSRKGLLFVGALSDENSPNTDSLLWFLCNVLPQIERHIPDIDLQVAGNTGAASLVSIERSNVHMKGRLDSLNSLYQSCRVFIAPTRYAAGIPHKVHEAAAYGVPSVVTPLLAKQLGWKHQREVLVAENSKEFANECIRLYTDTELWQFIVKNARRALEQDCSETKFRRTLMNLFQIKRTSKD